MMLERFLPKSEFSKNIVTLTSGTALAQAIPFLVTPILSRIYTPHEFGIFAEFMSYALIMGVVATGRYELAILLPKRKEDAINLLALSVTLAATLCLLLLLCIPFLHESVGRWSDGNPLIEWLYYYPLIILLMALNQSLSYWYTRKKKYKALSYNKISQSISVGGFKLTYGLFNVNAFGLIMGNIVGLLFSVLLFGMRFIKEDLLMLKVVRPSAMKELAMRYIKFPKFDMSSGVLNTFSSQIPIMMLSFYFNPFVVGWYATAHIVLRLPMTFLGTSIGQVFFQRSSELKAQPKELKALTFNLYKKLFFIGVLPLGLIGGFGDAIFEIFLGKEWLEAGRYAQWLSPWLLVVFITAPVSQLINVLEKQQLNLIFNVIIIVVRVIAVLVGGIFLEDALLTVMLFGGVSFVFWFFFSFYLLKQVGISYRESVLFTLPRLVIVSSFIVLLRIIVNNLM